MSVNKKKYEKLSEQYNKMLAERNSLIGDVIWHEANSERYRKRAENAMDYAERSQCEVLRLEQIREIKDSALKGADIKVETLERENEKLQGRLDEFLEHDYDNQKLYKENRNLLSEISQHIGNKPSSSTYKYFRAKLDFLGIKEGE